MTGLDAFDRVHRGYDAGMRLGAWARDREVCAAMQGVRLVVDVGGGTGRLARRLARQGASVVLVDPSAGMLGHRPRAAAAVRGDGRALPLADGAAGAVVIADVLHHVPGHRRLLAEARRVLRPGGRCVVVEFDARRAAVRWFGRLERLAFGHCRYLHPRELAADLAAAGFIGVRLRRLGWQVLASAEAGP